MNRKELARVMAARRGKTIQEAEKWESAMLDAMADADVSEVEAYVRSGKRRA